MSAPFIQADYNQLLAIAQRFKHNAATIATLRQQLQAMVNQLHHDWSGSAALAFFHEFETVLNPALGRCHEVLLGAEQVTIQIRTIMRAAEEEAAALFKGDFGNGLIQGNATSASAPQAAPPRLSAAMLPGGWACV